MKEKYLPIGTVVLLKDATKMLMVTGYCSSTPEDPNKVYDYVASLFPEGNLAGESVALFNHEQIGTIAHMGLENDEFKKLDKTIKDAMATPQLPTNSLDNLAPFTPENINLILEEINKQGDALKPIAEPTAFNEDVIKKPVFELPSLGGDTKKEEKKEETSVKKESIEEKVVERSDADGQPVLQLQPIFDGNQTSGGTDGSTAPASDGIIGLARL